MVLDLSGGQHTNLDKGEFVNLRSVSCDSGIHFLAVKPVLMCCGDGF